MAKFELDLVTVYDFELLAIASHAPDYRLCWSLNKLLEINLEKIDKTISSQANKKSEYISYSMFNYLLQEDNLEEYYLINNRSEGNVLLTEFKQIDYLLLLKGIKANRLEDILKTIKQSNLVLTAFKVELETFKAKDKLLF